jgi:hypothetical protein
VVARLGVIDGAFDAAAAAAAGRRAVIVAAIGLPAACRLRQADPVACPVVEGLDVAYVGGGKNTSVADPNLQAGVGQATTGEVGTITPGNPLLQWSRSRVATRVARLSAPIARRQARTTASP